MPAFILLASLYITCFISASRYNMPIFGYDALITAYHRIRKVFRMIRLSDFSSMSIASCFLPSSARFKAAMRISCADDEQDGAGSLHQNKHLAYSHYQNGTLFINRCLVLYQHPSHASWFDHLPALSSIRSIPS